MNFDKNKKMKLNILMKFVLFIKRFLKKIIFVQLILNAKCHAIRDAQLLEKKQIKQEIQEEDKRLDMIMEIERINALQIQEQIERKRQQQAKE